MWVYQLDDLTIPKYQLVHFLIHAMILYLVSPSLLTIVIVLLGIFIREGVGNLPCAEQCLIQEQLEPHGSRFEAGIIRWTLRHDIFVTQCEGKLKWVKVISNNSLSTSPDTNLRSVFCSFLWFQQSRVEWVVGEAKGDSFLSLVVHRSTLKSTNTLADNPLR